MFEQEGSETPPLVLVGDHEGHFGVDRPGLAVVLGQGNELAGAEDG
jgi:hypothetical protein